MQRKGTGPRTGRMVDGQVLRYIAWKREWKAHHQENYLGLQGDALRRVHYLWQDSFLHD
jgi:hypothetical protein